MKREVKVLLIALILVPLGLLARGAWGEWGKEELKQILGFVPQGVEKFYNLWKAPFADYTIIGLSPVVSYVLSGIIGAGLVFLFFLLFKKRS